MLERSWCTDTSVRTWNTVVVLWEQRMEHFNTNTERLLQCFPTSCCLTNRRQAEIFALFQQEQQKDVKLSGLLLQKISELPFIYDSAASFWKTTVCQVAENALISSAIQPFHSSIKVWPAMHFLLAFDRLFLAQCISPVSPHITSMLADSIPHYLHPVLTLSVSSRSCVPSCVAKWKITFWRSRWPQTCSQWMSFILTVSTERGGLTDFNLLQMKISGCSNAVPASAESVSICTV